VLTRRKGLARDVDPTMFGDLSWLDETGRTHQWRVADTTVDLPVGDDDEVFTMRQVNLLVANNKTGREQQPAASTRQIHILTTRTDLPVEQVIYRMGSRWRQENHFRYARMHFDLDSHDAYATTDDDPDRLVPNPAKKKAHQQVLAARARYERPLAATDAALLDAVSPPQRQAVLITNADHDKLTADLRDAEATLDTAQHAHRAVPARLPLGQVNPGQQVLDIQTKLVSHAIRIAAFNTATALARAVRVHTGYARANHEAHALIRQALTGSGDIDPGNSTLTVRARPPTNTAGHHRHHATVRAPQRHTNPLPRHRRHPALRGQNPPLTTQEFWLYVRSPELDGRHAGGYAWMTGPRSGGTSFRLALTKKRFRRAARTSDLPPLGH
jgi:hypothetical protein